MTTHKLKVFIKYADAIMNGTKTFEIRKNARMPWAWLYGLARNPR